MQVRGRETRIQSSCRVGAASWGLSTNLFMFEREGEGDMEREVERERETSSCSRERERETGRETWKEK